MNIYYTYWTVEDKSRIILRNFKNDATIKETVYQYTSRKTIMEPLIEIRLQQRLQLKYFRTKNRLE